MSSKLAILLLAVFAAALLAALLVLLAKYRRALHPGGNGPSAGGTVPAEEDNGPGEDGPLPEREAPPSQEGTRMLIVQDESTLDFLTENLGDEFVISGADDGPSALEAAKTGSPDIIITEMGGDNLSGIELCTQLKSDPDTSHIPVIFLTAMDERENIIFGLESGATDYITKPFDITVLRARIKSILRDRQRLRDSILNLGAEDDTPDYATILDKEFMDRVLKVINDNLSNGEFSTDDFSKEMAMSRTSLYNKIKALTGQAPYDFLRIYRLNKAKELLVSQRFSISEVSDMVGFSDPKYFSVCFKKHFGVSPSRLN